MRIATIGCGYWGKNLTRNLSELGVLAAICDANEKNAVAIAKEFNVPSMSLEQVLSSDVDAVVIAAPSPQHYILAKKAILAGKHVFVEKPFTLKYSEAKELHSLAITHARKIMVGHLLQYHAAFLALSRLVKRGDLGQISYIVSNRLNFGHFKYDENILWDFAPHDLSMILTLANDIPETVYASGACQVEPGSHDTVNVSLAFGSGLQAQINVSRMHPYKEQKLVVVGEQGMAVFEDGLPWDEKLKLYQHSVSQRSGVPVAHHAEVINIALNPLEPLKLECQHFVECIKTDMQPRTDSTEALEVIKVLHAAQQSLQMHDKVMVKHGAFASEIAFG